MGVKLPSFHVKRVVNKEDIDKMIYGAQEYHSTANLPYRFDGSYWSMFWCIKCDNGGGYIWAAYDDQDRPVNALGGFVGHDQNSGDRIFTEAFFFAAKGGSGQGMKVLQEAERDLKEIGVARMHLSSHLDFRANRTAKFYSCMGFKPDQIMWSKDL